MTDQSDVEWRADLAQSIEDLRSGRYRPRVIRSTIRPPKREQLKLQFEQQEQKHDG